MVVTAIEEEKYLSQLTLEELTRSLLSHEARLNQEEESLTNALSTQWLLDSGCSNHMTCNKSLFSSLDSSIVTNIKLGDDFLVLAKGKGSVPIFTKQNEKKFIHEVFYVPHLNVNLISIGELLHNKYDL